METKGHPLIFAEYLRLLPWSDQLIAIDPDDYLKKAVALARDREKFSQIRKDIGAAARRIIGNHEHFAVAFAKKMRQAYSGFCSTE